LQALLREAAPKWRAAAVAKLARRLQQAGISSPTELAHALFAGECVGCLGALEPPLRQSMARRLRNLLGLKSNDGFASESTAAFAEGKAPESEQKCEIVPMGHYCLTTFFLMDEGLRHWAFPVDWSAHTFKVWLKMLQDDFSTLLTPPIPGQRHPYNSVSGDVQMFPHQGQWADERVRCRVERLRGILSAGHGFGFSVYLEGPDFLGCSMQEVIEDAKAVARLEPGFREVAIIWMHEQSARASTKWEHHGDRVSLLHFTPVCQYRFEGRMRLQQSDREALLVQLAERFPSIWGAAALAHRRWVCGLAADVDPSSSEQEIEEHWDDHDPDEALYFQEAERRKRQKKTSQGGQPPRSGTIEKQAELHVSATVRASTAVAGQVTSYHTSAPQLLSPHGAAAKVDLPGASRKELPGSCQMLLRTAQPALQPPKPKRAEPGPGKSLWKLIFRQRRGKSLGHLDSWSVTRWRSRGSLADDLYCCFDTLEHYRAANGQLTFKMVFPRLGSRCNIWRQETNPVTMPPNGNVHGFEPLQLSFTCDNDHDNAFGGLQKSRQQEEFLLHNYDPRFPDRYWFAVGSTRPFWPGAGGNMRESSIELYVLMPPRTAV